MECLHAVRTHFSVEGYPICQHPPLKEEEKEEEEEEEEEEGRERGGGGGGGRGGEGKMELRVMGVKAKVREEEMHNLHARFVYTRHYQFLHELSQFRDIRFVVWMFTEVFMGEECLCVCVCV